MQVTTTTSNTPAIPQRNGPDGRKIAKLISRTSSGRDEQKGPPASVGDDPSREAIAFGARVPARGWRTGRQRLPGRLRSRPGAYGTAELSQADWSPSSASGGPPRVCILMSG
jgi:hypothetical protein